MRSTRSLPPFYPGFAVSPQKSGDAVRNFHVREIGAFHAFCYSTVHGLAGISRPDRSGVRGVRRVWVFRVRATDPEPVARKVPDGGGTKASPDLWPNDANFYRDFRHPAFNLCASIHEKQHCKSRRLDRGFLLFGRRCNFHLAKSGDRTGNLELESGTIASGLEIRAETLGDRSGSTVFFAIGGLYFVLHFARGQLTPAQNRYRLMSRHRLAS